MSGRDGRRSDMSVYRTGEVLPPSLDETALQAAEQSLAAHGRLARSLYRLGGRTHVLPVRPIVVVLLAGFLFLAAAVALVGPFLLYGLTFRAPM